MPQELINNGQAALAVRNSINSNFGELYTSVAQSTTQALAFPLSAGTAALRFDRLNTVYALHTVAGAIAFTVNATDAVNGNETTAQLVANGVNTPTFSSDFKKVSGSYDNRAGILNTIEFKRIAGFIWYSIFQEYAEPTAFVPGAPLLLIAEGAGSNQITLTYSEPLDLTSVPATTDYTINAGTISSLAVAGVQVRLTLAANSAASGLTVGYTPGTNPVRNAGGIVAGSFVNIPVNAGPVLMTFGTRTSNITDEAGGTGNLTWTSPTWASTFALADQKLPTDGWVSMEWTGTGTRPIILGLDANPTNKTYNASGDGYDYGVYISPTLEVLVVTAGVIVAGAVATGVAVNTVFRLRRNGTAITIERSVQGGSWGVLHTWTGVPAGDLFCNFAANTTSSLLRNPRIKGGVAR